MKNHFFFNKDKKFKLLKVGSKFSYICKITSKKIKKYTEIIQDKNPLHLVNKKNKKRVMSHGMLIGSLTATLLGTYSPINNNVLVSISLNFRKPVYSGDKLKVEGIIKNKINSYKMLVIKLNISKNKINVVDGQAIVKVKQK